MNIVHGAKYNYYILSRTSYFSRADVTALCQNLDVVQIVWRQLLVQAMMDVAATLLLTDAVPTKLVQVNNQILSFQKLKYFNTLSLNLLYAHHLPGSISLTVLRPMPIFCAPRLTFTPQKSFSKVDLHGTTGTSPPSCTAPQNKLYIDRAPYFHH